MTLPPLFDAWNTLLGYASSNRYHCQGRVSLAQSVRVGQSRQLVDRVPADRQ